jgi:hypothetical protein
MPNTTNIPTPGVTKDRVAILPDDSAFSTGSFPLPKDHWVYTTTGEGFTGPPPMPFRMGTLDPQREIVRRKIMEAARHAIRASTRCGRDWDFDPDAMVGNLVAGLIGYHSPDGLHSEPWGNPDPIPPMHTGGGMPTDTLTSLLTATLGAVGQTIGLATDATLAQMVAGSASLFCRQRAMIAEAASASSDLVSSLETAEFGAVVGAFAKAAVERSAAGAVSLTKIANPASAETIDALTGPFGRVTPATEKSEIAENAVVVRTRVHKNAPPWQDPTEEMLADPRFIAIWDAIKRWDISVPSVYTGYTGASGNHARVIFDALLAADADTCHKS